MILTLASAAVFAMAEGRTGRGEETEAKADQISADTGKQVGDKQVEIQTIPSLIIEPS